MKWIMIVALASFPSAAAFDWESAIRTARLLQADGRYEEAASILSAAVKLAEKFDPGDPRLVRSISGLASVYQDLGRFSEAEDLYRRAMNTEGSLAIEPLNGLASLYFQVGQYTRSERLTQRCLALEESSVPPDVIGVARQHANLAAVYQAERKYAGAEDEYKKALDIFEMSGVRESPELAFALNSLGALRMRAGRQDESVALVERAVAMWESAFGAVHPVYAQGLANLASVYGLAGRSGEAEALWKRALPIVEKTLGAQHPVYGLVLNSYADFLERLRRMPESRRVRRQSKNILAAQRPDDTASGRYLVDFRDLSAK